MVCILQNSISSVRTQQHLRWTVRFGKQGNNVLGFFSVGKWGDAGISEGIDLIVKSKYLC